MCNSTHASLESTFCSAHERFRPLVVEAKKGAILQSNGPTRLVSLRFPNASGGDSFSVLNSSLPCVTFPLFSVGDPLPTPFFFCFAGELRALLPLVDINITEGANAADGGCLFLEGRTRDVKRGYHAYFTVEVKSTLSNDITQPVFPK